jgi:hypothetical protein
MKKVLIVLFVMGLLVVGGGMYAWNKAKSAVGEIVNTVKGGEISKPKMENWGKLKEGLTLDESQKLLGEGVNYTITVNEVATTYLIYTYSDGILGAPSGKGHSLEFDGSGKLVKWTEPTASASIKVTTEKEVTK